MVDALIGYTGFVGSNIGNSRPFDAGFNSRNIGEIRGREFDLVVSSGNRADSFRINNEPEIDRREIDELIDTLAEAKIGKLVLISTVCVYPEGGAPDEDTVPTERGLTPYGVNRLHQERRLSELFDTTIVRLPQLYGSNLKKGVVYDLAHDYRVDYIRPEVEFQHYDVRRLWNDISTALAAGLPSLNVATPAINNEDLAREVFDLDIRGQVPPGEENPFSRMYTRNMTTRHGELFGGGDGYFHDRATELAGLRAFVEETTIDREI